MDMRLILTPFVISRSRKVLRMLQVIFSITILGTLACSFDSGKDSNGNSIRLGSHETTFLLLVAYTSLLYAAWYLVCVECFPMTLRPDPITTRRMDGAMALVLLLAGVMLLASDYVTECSSYGKLIMCGKLKASTTFAFLTAMPFAASMGLTYALPTTDFDDMTIAEGGYRFESTPTAASMDKNGDPLTPSIKV